MGVIGTASGIQIATLIVAVLAVAASLAGILSASTYRDRPKRAHGYVTFGYGSMERRRLRPSDGSPTWWRQPEGTRHNSTIRVVAICTSS